MSSFGIVPSQYHALLDEFYGPAWRNISQDQAIGLATVVAGSNGTILPTANGNQSVESLRAARAQSPSQAASQNPTNWTTIAGQQQSYNPTDNSMSFGAAPDVAGMFSGLKWTPTTQQTPTFDAAHQMAYDPQTLGGKTNDEFNAILNSGSAQALNDFYANYVATDQRNNQGEPLWWVPKQAAEQAAQLQRDNDPNNAARKEAEYQRIAARAFSDPNTLQAISQDPWNLGFRDSVDAKFTQADVDRFQREYMTQIGAQPNSAQLIAAAAGQNNYIDPAKLTAQANQYRQQALTQPATAANNAFLAAAGANGGTVPQGLLNQQQPTNTAPQGQPPMSIQGLLAQQNTAPNFAASMATGAPMAQNWWEGNTFRMPQVNIPDRSTAAPGLQGQAGQGTQGAAQATQSALQQYQNSIGQNLNANNLMTGSLPGGPGFVGGATGINAGDTMSGDHNSQMSAANNPDVQRNSSYADSFGLLGSAAGAGMGIPGMGILGGAIGGYVDANKTNQNFQNAYGNSPISAGSAALAGATKIPFTDFSLFGSSAWNQAAPWSYSAPTSTNTPFATSQPIGMGFSGAPALNFAF